VIMPYPGTPLFEEAVREGWLRFDKTDYEKLAMDQPAMKNIEMMPEEIQEMCKLNYWIYLSPSYILHHIKNRVRSFEDLRYSIQGFTSVIGHMKDFSRKPDVQKDKSELLNEEQIARMLANMHNPRQDLVAIKAGTNYPIPHKKLAEVKVALPISN